MAGEPVSRILFAARRHPGKHPGSSRQRGDHSSRSRIAPGLKQPTRGLQRARSCERNAYGPGRPSPPIWPCSTRGFPCPGCCHPGGGLLPHLFTLAKCARPKQAGFGFSESLPPRCKLTGGLIFCGTFRSRAARTRFRAPGDATPWRYQARCPAVAGSCEFATAGVRTFLPPIPLARSGPAITRLTRCNYYTTCSARRIDRRETAMRWKKSTQNSSHRGRFCPVNCWSCVFLCPIFGGMMLILELFVPTTFRKSQGKLLRLSRTFLSSLGVTLRADYFRSYCSATVPLL